MKKIILLLVICFACIFIITGCKKNTTSSDSASAKSGGTLKFIYAFSPGANIGWPLDDTNTQRMWGTNFVFAEPLVLYKTNGEIEGILATSWKFSKDFSSITFTLRKGVKFQDGTDFNAYAVKSQLDKIIEEKKGNAANWKSVEILDDYKVRLNFSSYTNTFWGDITNTNCFFVSPTPYREKGLDWVREHPVGTGPFKFVSWARDQNMIFEKNPDYWQEGKPHLDRIEFITVKEPMTQQAAIRGGDGDVLALQSGKTLDDMKKLGFNIYAYPAGTNMLIPDTANAGSLFKDKKVREAVEYAIDKKAIVDALGYGYMTVNAQMPSPPNPSFDPSIKGRDYDPEKAKKLLNEAGFPNGFKTNIYTFYTDGVALTLQRYLKAVGIEAEVNVVDNLKFWDYNRNGWKNGMMYCGYAFDPNFAASFKAFFPPYTQFANMSLKPPEGVKSMIDAALSETDPDDHKKLNQKLSKAIYEDASLICIMSDAMGYVVSPKVKNGHWLEGNDFQYWSPADTWLSEK